MIDRRSLLRQSLKGAALASLPAGLAPVLARAASIAPDRRTGTINDVAHIVVLMQENRGFDHYFGTMPGVRGFGDRFPIPSPPMPTARRAPSGTSAMPPPVRPGACAPSRSPRRPIST
jgi:phospholipase C